MQSIYELVTLDCQNEHDLEHKTKFSTPKIFDAKGDLSKRWYIYFSYRNPRTGKLKRMKNIYGKAHRFKTKESRYSVLNLYKRRLLKLLKEGYNPFEDNTKFHSEKLKVISQKATILQPKQNMNQTVLDSQQPKFDAVDIYQPNSQPKTVLVEGLKKKTVVDELATAKGHTIDEALDRALLLKINIVSKTTLNDYKSRINQLKKWLKANNKDIIYCNQISKKMVVEFLNYIQLKTSARNRNNYRTVFSSIFQILEDNEIIEKNFISQIKSIKTQPKRNKTYSIKEQEAIFEYLEVNDQLLLLYIKFVSYNLLRPIEVCRLRVKDINLEEKKLQVQAKNKILKTKIIPDKLFKELPDLSKMDGELLLFTPDKLCGHWDTELINRRNYFSNRFKTIVKDHFGYNENYGLYSFRHTFITKLYRGMVKNSSPYNAKSELMEITGHTTMTALEKYLRDIDAQLPEDYSNLL
ncbi:tyrosine-type recombinase/integrase [Winogradskyella helgolandensis]|uniref:tyrosine-type recombinase/integrase n=1 Tax=Winogradskyella helgolandensis TaxID=2697010 RepID=UPI0015C6B44B|nr:tyrosine-type recombinase/integrase [Winogradskyella helgolandensis]